VTLRKYVFDQCSRPSSQTLDTTSLAQNVIPQVPCDATQKVFALSPSATERSDFAMLKSMSNDRYAPRGLQERVFRYLMEAPTFAFNDAEQQETINLFWRVSAAGDPKSCANRPTRQIDPKDGTHCLPNSSTGSAAKGSKIQFPVQVPADR
jgi:hypothetical protein